MPGKKSIDIIREITKRTKELNIFDRTLNKVKIVSAGDGKCTAEFTVEEEHTNMRGSLHGGFSSTLVDMISTYAIMTHKKEVPGVSVDMHMTFMNAAHLGDEVVVESNTIRAGRTLAFLDVKIKNKKTGDILVYGTHTKFIAV